MNGSCVTPNTAGMESTCTEEQEKRQLQDRAQPTKGRTSSVLDCETSKGISDDVQPSLFEDVTTRSSKWAQATEKLRLPLPQLKVKAADPDRYACRPNNCQFLEGSECMQMLQCSLCTSRP
jgi:hypothetical protein